MRELWHAAGRAAREDRKRFVALQGVLVTAGILVVAAALWTLFSEGPQAAFSGLARPFALLVTPLREAYLADNDFALLGYIAWIFFALQLSSAWFGTALARLAAMHLTERRQPTRVELTRFVRRHARHHLAARLILFGGCIAPLLLAALLALGSHLPGSAGTIALGVASIAALALALLATVLGSLALVGGFLPGPVLAFEDSDTFDALGRTLTYVRAGLPRLLLTRLVFLSGVLLGSAWRALRTVAAILLAALIVRGVAGAEPIDRVLAIWQAFGPPADADRLGITTADYIVAGAVGLAVLGLAVLWLADLWSRVACGRAAAYLSLRRAIDGVPTDVLRAAPGMGETPGSRAS